MLLHHTTPYHTIDFDTLFLITVQHEMHLLRHKDNFSPDKVVQKALEVGNTILFPR